MLLLAPQPSSAQKNPPKRDRDDSEAGIDGYADYQLWASTRDPVSFGAPGPAAGSRRELLHQRLRLYTEGSTGFFRGVAEVDLATGILAESNMAPTVAGVDSGTRPTGRAFESTPRIADPRRAFVEGETANGTTRVQVGLQTSHWGLGIRTNDGVTEYDQLFNYTYGGDRRLRGMVAAAPFRHTHAPVASSLVVAFGGDLIYRDEFASLRAGDRGGQGFLAVLFEGRRTEIGQYGTVRSVEHADGDLRSTTTLDTYAEHLWSNSEGWDFRFSAEAVFALGTIEPSTRRPEDPEDEIRGTGLASEFLAHYRPADVRLELRSGYASGDSDPYDDTRRQFQFDPNYRVGLIMFDSYLPAASRTSYRRVTTSDSAGVRPADPASLVHDGGVVNALYLHPSLKFGDADGWMTGLSFLWARAAQPLTDPYASFHNGGAPTGIGGRYPASRDLGWEVDTAVRYRHRLGFGPTLELKGEYGIYVPGRAFEEADGSPAPPINLLRATLGAFW